MIDVYEEGNEVIHVTEKAVGQSVTEVIARVDWARRHDHIQQHTGQHIFSQALIQVCEIPTVGFTIGPDWSTIVLDRRPSQEDLDSAIELANRVIDEDRRVEVLYPTQEELGTLPIRGALPEKDRIRIVRVGDFDWSPCGGTHSTSTGDVRLILVLGIAKEKNSFRLEFVCGRRAEKIALDRMRSVDGVARILDASPSEVIDRTQQMLDKLRAQESTIEAIREERTRLDADRLLANLDESPDKTVAVKLAGRTINEVRSLAHLLVKTSGTVALIVGTDGDKVGIAFGRSSDRPEDMNAVMRSVCESLDVRGGGNPAFANGGGGGGQETADRILDAARRALAQLRD